MVTDGIMEMIWMLYELCADTKMKNCIDLIEDILSEYSEDGWYLMSDTERKLWLCDVLTRYNVSFAQDE